MPKSQSIINADLLQVIENPTTKLHLRLKCQMKYLMAFEKVAPEIDFCDLAAVVNYLKVVHCCYFGMKLVHCVHKSDARICKQEEKKYSNF